MREADDNQLAGGRHSVAPLCPTPRHSFHLNELKKKRAFDVRQLLYRLLQKYALVILCSRERFILNKLQLAMLM